MPLHATSFIDFASLMAQCAGTAIAAFADYADRCSDFAADDDADACVRKNGHECYADGY